MNRYLDWLRAAQNDLEWGRHSLKDGFFAQACFISQQVAEKSLKALALFRGVEQVKSHSIVRIAKELEINGEIEEMGKQLDQYYIPARYPDAFPEGAPQDFFTETQAKQAIEFANKFLVNIQKLTEGKS